MATREELLQRKKELLEQKRQLLLQEQGGVAQMGEPRPEQQASFPGFEELKSTGGDVLDTLGKATGSGMMGSEKNIGGFPELFRRMGNLVIPQSLPSGEQVQQKAGETVSGIANAPAAIANLPSMASTEEGRRSLALGTVSGLDVGERVEQGDLLGLLADVATVKPGLTASVIGKGARTTKTGARIADKVTDVYTDIGSGVRNLGSSVISVPPKLISYFNDTAGVPPIARRQFREAVHAPKQLQLMKDAAANIEGSTPRDIARKTSENARGWRDAKTERFGQGLEQIDLNVPIPEPGVLIDAIRKDLESIGVRINPKTREIVFDKDYMGIDGDRVHTDMQRRQIKDGDEAGFGEFDNAGIQGDINTANAILGNMTTLESKIQSTVQKPSLGDLREILTNLGRLQSDKDLLGSNFKDLMLGQATGRIRKHIVDAAEKFGLPEAQQLRKLNDQYQVDLDTVAEVMADFNITGQTISNNEAARKMIKMYDRDKKTQVFRDAKIRLMEELDPNREIIPALLAWQTADPLPPATFSRFLGGAQMAGITGIGTAATAQFLGLPFAIPAGAIIGTTLALSVSPAFIRRATMGLERSQQHGLLSRINIIREKTPDNLIKEGITIGAAFDRIQKRGEDIGSAEEDILTQLGGGQRNLQQ